MGVTVVSSANSLGIQGKTAAAEGLAEGSGGNDFAALLTQLSAPQTLTLQLQSLTSQSAQTEPKDLSADSDEADASTLQDLSAMLAAVGLLQGPLANTKPSQATEDDGNLPSNGNAGKQEAIAGVVGQLDLTPGKNEALEPAESAIDSSLATALAGNTLRDDTANLAVEAKPLSGDGINFSNTLASHTTVAQQVQHEPTPTSVEVGTSIHDDRWTQDFGQKIVWLAKSEQQVAQMSLNPPQLGPMHITLNLSGDQASAFFVSPHAEVRQAIEDAMPHLREMLSNAGISLGQANVGTQLPQQNQGTPPQFSGSSRPGGDNAILRADDGQGAVTTVSTVRSGRGMVDLFA